MISTDVLEHCPEDDLAWIVDEIFGFADRFVFANVACYPASKRLPTGENAHCTIKPRDWWEELLRTVAARHPRVDWEVWVQYLEGAGSGARTRIPHRSRDRGVMEPVGSSSATIRARRWRSASSRSASTGARACRSRSRR